MASSYVFYPCKKKTDLALQAAGERWAVHASEEGADNVPVAAVAPERDPVGDEVPRASRRRRLFFGERLRQEPSGNVSGEDTRGVGEEGGKSC